MKAEYVGSTDYRKKKRLFFWPPEKLNLEAWELWQLHHALIIALRIMD